MRKHKTCIKTTSVSARPLRISWFYNFSAIVMRRQHADIKLCNFRRAVICFCSCRGGRVNFNSVCMLHLHAPNVLSVKKKSIYISHTVTDKWHATPSSLRSVSYGMEVTPVIRFPAAALFTYLFFVILYWMCQKRLSPGCTTNTRHPYTRYVSHFYSPRFNWIKFPNSGNDHVHQVQTWPLYVQPQTRRNWLSSFHAIRRVLEIVKWNLIYLVYF